MDSLAMAVIAVSLFVLFVETVGGSLYLDDLRAQAYALNQPFWSFIMGSNGTHFAPLPRILDWVQSRAFPLQHGPAIVVTLVVRLLFAIVFWRILRRIFGPRTVVLVPLTVALISPALLPATLWYRQSITIVACTVAMLWAVEAHLRWLQQRWFGALAEVVLATAIGLGFYEKAAALPIVLAGLSLALFARRPGRRRRAGVEPVLRPTIVSVLLSSAVVGAFLVIYRSGPYDQPGSGSLPSPFDVLHLTWDVVTRDVLPLMLGGPYSWTFSDSYAGTAHLSTTAIAIVLVIVGIGLVLTALRRLSPLLRGGLFLLAWTLPSVAIVAVGRFEQFQLVLADATRLWVDLVPAFVLAGALALIPWQIGACRSAAPGSASQPRTAGGRRANRAAAAAAASSGPAEVTVQGLAIGLVFVVIAIGSGVSTVTYLTKWWSNPTGKWIANMRTTVGAAEPYARVLATPLPETIMPSWVSSQLPTSAPLLQLIRGDLRFGDGDGQNRAINTSGALSPVIAGVISSTKPAALCVKRIPAGTKGYLGVKLTAPAPYQAGNQLQVGILLGEVTPVSVQVLLQNGKRVTPQTFSSEPLSSGGHVLLYPVPLGQTVTGVYVHTNSTKTGCIQSASVWAPVIRQ